MKKWQKLTALLSISVMVAMSGAAVNAAPHGAAAEQLSPQEQQFVNVMEAAGKVAERGPTQVHLIDQATLDLEDGYVFIPKKEAAAIMNLAGNETGPNFVGLILSPDDELRWSVDIEYIKSGYVRDDEAKKWNADELLASIKEGTEAANEERITKGFTALDVVGWIQKPTYDSTKHQLVWSLLAKERGSNSSEDQVVNYNTYALGRDGYFKLRLITPKAAIEGDKVHAYKILSGMNYNEGKRYQDFDEDTDHVAEYGIAALVAGVAAKKAGLLAIVGVLLAKFAKVGIFAAFVFIASFKNKILGLFKRKKKVAPETEQAAKIDDEESPSNS